MFGIDSGELLIIAVVALVVIGPKDLPRVMRAIGNFVGKARGMARHFRSGVDTMIRESELADMEKQWAAENERIMRDHPPAAALAPPMPMIEHGAVDAVGSYGEAVPGDIAADRKAMSKRLENSVRGLQASTLRGRR